VGRGQYTLPDEIKMQYPTGRPESPSGEVIIEGKGVIPDFIVPITEESAIGEEDSVLHRAIKELLDKIN
jgi:C-terminal processing protease CtpA/Prc